MASKRISKVRRFRDTPGGRSGEEESKRQSKRLDVDCSQRLFFLPSSGRTFHRRLSRLGSPLIAFATSRRYSTLASTPGPRYTWLKGRGFSRFQRAEEESNREGKKASKLFTQGASLLINPRSHLSLSLPPSLLLLPLKNRSCKTSRRTRRRRALRARQGTTSSTGR